MAAKMEHDEAVAKFEKLLGEGDDDALIALAKEAMESTSTAVRAAACHAVAKLRLKKALMIIQGSSNAFPPLQEALRLYVEAEHQLGEAAVHDTMAQAYLLDSEVEMATAEAKWSFRMFGKSNSKKGIASSCKTLYEVYLAQGDKQKALMNLQERAKMLRSLGEKKELAEALTLISGMQLEKGSNAAAKSAAEEAAKLVEELGDKAGGKATNKVLSRVLALDGKVDAAPNRSQALTYLRLLGSALERRSEQEFKTTLYNLYDCGAYKDKEVHEALAPILERNQKAREFLQEMEVKLDGLAKLLVLEFDKTRFYANFRMNGLQYGPRHQTVRAYRRETGPANCMNVLQASHEAQDWEVECGYHLGILDGALQAGVVVQAPKF